jgi:hypothetical protein
MAQAGPPVDDIAYQRTPFPICEAVLTRRYRVGRLVVENCEPTEAVTDAIYPEEEGSSEPLR